MARGTCRAAMDTETEKAHKLARGPGLRAYINGVDLSNKTQLSDFPNDIYANSLYAASEYVIHYFLCIIAKNRRQYKSIFAVLTKY